jgi:hypothetical protein
MLRESAPVSAPSMLNDIASKSELCLRSEEEKMFRAFVVRSSHFGNVCVMSHDHVNGLSARIRRVETQTFLIRRVVVQTFLVSWPRVFD